ncbi:hypothetical protein V3473_31100, partial [Pseudomonas aeruginosa]|uniref:hypothetical protein n=1 Tax=Pseudomonas aeruginosa TaxID=287 RepID=UPI002F94AD8C
FKGTISILDKVKLADIDAGTRKTVTELRQKLDQYSSQVEDVLKASWMEFITTPCDTAVRRRHSDLLQEIVKENKAVAELGVTLGNQLKAGNAAGI